MKKFFQWPYVKRHWGSKGIADIVAVRPSQGCHECGRFNLTSQVAFIQCKFSSDSNKKLENKLDKKGKKDLVNFAKDCGAYPVYAYSYKHKTILIDLNTNMAFIP